VRTKTQHGPAGSEHDGTHERHIALADKHIPADPVLSGSWEHFAHDADVGVRGFGSTKEEAFEQAALAMSAVVGDVSAVRSRERVGIECEALDDELLFVEWLNRVIYEMATRKMLFSRFSVRIDGNRLYGEAWGEVVDRIRHQLAVEIKGATYTEVRVARENGRWLAQTVVDV
jgi:tRNA nucleotidyltransferase (CCA-adding enzyme)